MLHRNTCIAEYLELIRPGENISTQEWAETHVDFREDVTHFHRGRLVLRAYQREPLDASDNPAVHEATIVGSPRLGKSLLWKIPLVKRVWDGGETGLIVYPDDDEAQKTNRDTLEPLFRAIPRLAADLESAHSHTADSYHLSNSVVYFQGAGAQIVNKSVRLTVGDEVDYWTLAGTGENSTGEGRNVNQVQALKIRGQTFKDRLMILVSTPSTYRGPIWRRFELSSGGLWHLRCVHCGHLISTGQLAFPLKNGTYAGLQWSKDNDGLVVTDSIRYICPQCVYHHEFAQAKLMTDCGQYVHARPQVEDHRGFRVNTLAAPDLFTWREIADAQEAKGTLEGAKFLNNYMMAKPFSPGKDMPKEKTVDILQKHVRQPPPDAAVSSVFCSADVQGYGEGQNYFVCVVRVFDENGNSWRCFAGKKMSLGELHELSQERFHGLKITMGCVDQGGFDHDKSGIPEWIATHPGWVWVKGDTQAKATQLDHWAPSDTQARLFLAHPIWYQTKLLDAIYSHAEDAPEYYWSLPPDIGQEYADHIRAVKPSNRRYDGLEYDSWTAGSDRHDFFDAEKMIFTLLDVASHHLPSAYWARGKMPLFLRKELRLEMIRKGLVSG